MKIPLRRIGNSEGVIIPRAMLAQLALSGEVEMTIEKGALVLRQPKAARTGWAEASRSLAAVGEDTLEWPE